MTSRFEHVTASPLCWPAGWKRHRGQRERARFGKRTGSYGGLNPLTINQATESVLRELARLGVRRKEVIISTDLRLRRDGLPVSSQRAPDDPGVAVYFRWAGRDKALALDQYDRIADNLRAVALTIEALRGIDRWGAGEFLDRAFTGFTALPPPASSRPWRQVLGIDGMEIRHGAVRDAYRRLRSRHHPDKGGDQERFNEIEQAWQQARQELRA